MGEPSSNSKTPEEHVLRVGASTPAAELASAIAHGIDDGKPISLRAIGAGAVNQAVKAIAIAQGYVGGKGISLLTRPGFTTVEMPDGQVTAIIFRIFTS